MTDTELKFFCIEPVTVVIKGESTTYEANTLVDIFLRTSDEFEVIPTSNSSISSVYAWPGAIKDIQDELETISGGVGSVGTQIDNEKLYKRLLIQKR